MNKEISFVKLEIKYFCFRSKDDNSNNLQTLERYRL